MNTSTSRLPLNTEAEALPKEIRCTWYFNHSPQKIWEHLTQPELLEQWLGKTDFQPIVGHKFRFLSPYGNDSYCEVLEVKPFTKLSYSWQKNSAKDNRPFNSKVTWTLVPKEQGTELQLVHNGFTVSEDLVGHEKGWSTCLKQFEERLESREISKMNTKNNFNRSISAEISASEATKRISNVPDWWGITFSGNSEKQNDQFTVKMSGDSFFNFTVTELVPGKRIVWLVTDCNMPWYSDKTEWTNTRLIFDLTENNGVTNLVFTHEGLTPEVECYKDCEPGWTHWIKTSLFSYFTTGKGVFRKPSI